MFRRLRPSRRLLLVVTMSATALFVALVGGLSAATVQWWAWALLVVVLGATAVDHVRSRRAWAAAAPTLARHLPEAFAIGVAKSIALTLDTGGTHTWSCELYDHVDPSVETSGLPMPLTLAAGTRLDTSYTLTPTRRGEIVFGAADVRVRSLWQLSDLLVSLGPVERRRVFPDFAQVARYAWLAGDRRLQAIGIKTQQQRGEGTEFKELAEYRVGDAVRHIDWRATLRLDKPIVRQFQDERNQCVMLLVDCGRRLRADDRSGTHRTTHFDQVLNAALLLTYVALRQGDAVGAMTFGTPVGGERAIAPQKGIHALHSLMAELHDVQPTPTHSDYVGAARTLLERHHKRSLVVVLTNFRDEDSAELSGALRLLRSRHLVMLASLRERVVQDLMEQPLGTTDAAVAVASAHVYEQARRDAFGRLAARDALMIDAAPERLAIDLVNRYHHVKRLGLI